MTKSELQIGMLLELREGGKFILMPNQSGELVGVSQDGCYFMMSNRNSDLTSKTSPKGDIVAVYDRGYNPEYLLSFNEQNRRLIWKRNDIKEMTMEEISNALGYEVKLKK